LMAGLLRKRCRCSQKFRTILTVSVFLATCAPAKLPYAQSPDSPPVSYRSAETILALTPEQAGHEVLAQLRGVVTLCTDTGGLVLQDRTAGIWISSDLHKDCQQGEEVEIHGDVRPGLFSHLVQARSIRKLGRSPLPKPQEVTFRQMSTGDEDDQYVSITGVVRSAGLRPSDSNLQRLWLKIAMADGFVYASFPGEDADAGSKLIDAVVRIEGATLSMKNARRQITAPTFLMVTGMHGITVLRPPPRDLFALPLTPISKLMQFRSGTNSDHRVRIAGAVTYYKPGESLVLEDEGRALLIMTTQRSDIKLGDRVEALGFPALQDSGPILQDAVLRYIAHGQQLQPTRVKIADLTSGAFNNNLVSIDGRLLRRVYEPYREVLLLQDKSDLLLAELTEPDNSKILDKVREGSSIRITGVTILEVTDNWNPGRLTASSVHYKVLLRSTNDIQVNQPPSWWTTLHVIYIAAMLGVLVLVFLALVVYGRMEGWRLHAVLEERERLANDIHDTLAQSFAGIGFQLQAIRRAIPDEASDLRQQIDLARALVRHSQKEARRSLEPLSRETTEEIDLLASLENSARTMVEGGSVEVTAVSTGTPRLLPPQIAAPLLRIGQEAIANAIRHGDPSHLDISIAYDAAFVRLAVRDNGCGFVKSGNLLGFGLRGMRKRSAALSANLEIVSQPGEGTLVEVTAPLPPDLTLYTFFQQMWNYLLERVIHVDAKIK
jgi:signal transduction histidine kinase